MKRGQTWSLELIATVVLFLVAIVIFGNVVLKKSAPSTRPSVEAEKAINSVSTNTSVSFIDDAGLNKSKAINFNYSLFKQQTGVKSRVCIYFEDKNGKLISINSSVSGIGDTNISIDGVPCSNDG